jgi:hypothetical protein
MCLTIGEGYAHRHAVALCPITVRRKRREQTVDGDLKQCSLGETVAGMALSNSVGPKVHHISEGVTELLVPFFLAGIGLNLDVRRSVIRSWRG